MHGEVGWPQDRRGAAVAADADADAVGAFVRVDACHDPVGAGLGGADADAGSAVAAPGDRFLGAGCSGVLDQARVAGARVPVAEVVALGPVSDERRGAVAVSWPAVPSHLPAPVMSSAWG